MITDLCTLTKIREQYSDKTIVFTRGSFDIVHNGHIGYLQEVAALGDILVVALARDEDLRSRKGADRPILTLNERMCVMDSLKYVDFVLPLPSSATREQNKQATYEVLEKLRPDIFATSYNAWKNSEQHIKDKYGTKLKLITEKRPNSTTAIISKIRERESYAHYDTPESILRACKMIQTGHFIGKQSGKHFHTFIDKDYLLASPSALRSITEKLAQQIHKKFHDIDLIAGPLTGGAILAQLVAQRLGTLRGQDTPCIYFDKKGERDFTLRETFAKLCTGKNVVLIDDTVRSGQTLKTLAVQLQNKYHTKTCNLVCVLNRNPVLAEKNLRDYNSISLVTLPEEGYAAENLPAWLQAMPLTQPAKSQEKYVIGVTGRIGAGKTTLVREFQKMFPDSERFATGDILKETLELWGIPASREALINLSRVLREHISETVIVDAVRARIEKCPHKYILIDGVRGHHVLELLREYDSSLLIAIVTAPELRHARITKRQEKSDEIHMNKAEFTKLEEHNFQKETDWLVSAADISLTNDGNLDAFRKQIKNTLCQF